VIGEVWSFWFLVRQVELIVQALDRTKLKYQVPTVDISK
jgi:hypothetical protein